METIKTISNYIKSFPEETQILLNQIYHTIKKVAPDATESISYGIPAFKLNGKPLVYFAGLKNHIGFYATPTGHEAFVNELSKYKQGKGSVQFPLKEAMPLELIARITKFRVDENLKKK
ncbi:iron chaperone [Pedobacter namyangjuensis]|uniref:iron chaperone n=1 Tax=Pedobacter namyangjuensis TaxID=600626 RepID=UPI000DE51FF1|nr:DUF1801 domain-containing protein [Pedobacter namyangjuensis]